MVNQAGQTPTVAEMADRSAILDVLFQHCRGLDRAEAERLVAVYWPDATVDYGIFKGEAAVFAQLVVQGLKATYVLTRHTISNSLIELKGAHACVESYVFAEHLLTGAVEEMIFSGRYLDRLEKRGNEWRLIHRQVVMDWCRRRAVDAGADAEAFAAMAKGSHYPSDPLYAFLGN